MTTKDSKFDTSSKRQIGQSNTREQDGDFNMPMKLITRVRVKRLKEGFRKLAKSFYEKDASSMGQEKKRQLNGPTNENK